MNANDSCFPHTIIMEDRKKISLTGIKDILSFDDETVSVISVMGKAVIRGKEIKIESFNVENGDMVIEGRFDALVYLNDSSAKGSVIRRLFK